MVEGCGRGVGGTLYGISPLKGVQWMCADAVDKRRAVLLLSGPRLRLSRSLVQWEHHGRCRCRREVARGDSCGAPLAVGSVCGALTRPEPGVRGFQPLLGKTGGLPQGQRCRAGESPLFAGSDKETFGCAGHGPIGNCLAVRQEPFPRFRLGTRAFGRGSGSQ